MNDKKLSGKVAVITGASKGLGKAVTLALASAGAQLALASRDLKQLGETDDAARGLGAKAEVFQADVTDEKQVRDLEKEVVAKFNIASGRCEGERRPI